MSRWGHCSWALPTNSVRVHHIVLSGDPDIRVSAAELALLHLRRRPGSTCGCEPGRGGPRPYSSGESIVGRIKKVSRTPASSRRRITGLADHQSHHPPDSSMRDLCVIKTLKPGGIHELGLAEIEEDLFAGKLA